MKKIILASGSANRKSVMDALGIPYEAIAADIDEKAIRDEDFGVRAEKIARAKAEHVLSENPDSIIFSGDSFAVINGKIYEKPSSLTEARQMLQEQSEKKGKLYAGFCYIDTQNKINYSTTVMTDFLLSSLTNSQIDSYISKCPVLSWSGALNPSNPYCAGMFAEVNGPFSAFVYGFPADLVIYYLRKSGYKV